MRAGFVHVDGVRTRVLHAGGGYPVLLIHGLGTMAERWLRTLQGLGGPFALYAPDLLSSGFTDNVRFTGRPPQKPQLDHLHALLDLLKVETCAVVGSSYGGLLAILLHLQEPQRIRQLVIVGSGSALHTPDDQKRVLEAARANALTALADGTLDACRQRMERIAFDPSSVPPELAAMQLTANALPGRAEASLDLYDSLIGSLDQLDYQSFHRLEQIAAPTLLITGRDDPRASWTMAEAAARRIPDCELVVVDRCGHAPMLEHPALFNTRVRDFLERSRSRGAGVDQPATALG